MTCAPVGDLKADADVGPDQQPAGIGGRIFLLHLAEEHARADREQFGRERFVEDRVARRVAEDLVVGSTGPCKQVGEDAVLLQQVEQLAGHHGAEALDLGLVRATPICCACRDGRRGHSRSTSAGGDRAEQLHLLAAHDVGAAAADIGDAGDDRFALTGPDQLARARSSIPAGQGT